MHLALAKVTREALHKTDRSRRAIRAQDLRASCATWLGLAEQLPDGGAAIVGRRVSGSFVRDHLGHDRYETTERYYERGRGLRVEHVGVPFSPLPADLVARIPAENTCEDPVFAASEGDSEPAPPIAKTSLFPSLPTSRGTGVAIWRVRPSAGRRSSRSTPWSGSSALLPKLCGFPRRRGRASR